MGYTHHTLLSFIIIGTLLLAAGCDSPSTTPVPEEQQMNLLPIPDHGARALPGAPESRFDKDDPSPYDSGPSSGLAGQPG